MRILINDHPSEIERYRQIFRTHNYEDNELIFIHGFSQFQEFVATQLESQQFHIDLIITGDSAYDQGGDYLQATKLLHFKNMSIGCYSNRQLRIGAIPVILYSDTIGVRRRSRRGSFDAMVEKNTVGDHDPLVRTVEKVIRNWRKRLLEDLGVLELLGKNMVGLLTTRFYKEFYQPRVIKNAEVYFAQHTGVVSMDFIKSPSPFSDDWHQLSSANIEQQLARYFWGLANPKRYGGKWNEITVDHALLMENPIILTRGNYKDYLHEKSLAQSEEQSERCDFILRTDFPDILPTQFLEVKKKNVQFFKNKKRKNKIFTADLHDFLWQLGRYKTYAEDPLHAATIEQGIGYATSKFSYSLLAGRLEEKLEFADLLHQKMGAHYPGLEVLCYEDLGSRAEKYLYRFNRLFVGAGTLFSK